MKYKWSFFGSLVATACTSTVLTTVPSGTESGGSPIVAGSAAPSQTSGRTFRLVWPENGKRISGQIQLAIMPTAPAGASQWQIRYVTGHGQSSTLPVPANLIWDTTRLRGGTYELVLEALDQDGQVIATSQSIRIDLHGFAGSTAAGGGGGAPPADPAFPAADSVSFGDLGSEFTLTEGAAPSPAGGPAP